MHIRLIIAILFTFHFELFTSSTARAQIVFADYSDPDVCQAPDGSYWMTASSFQTTPGLPLLHSTDLVNWECVNYALEKLIPEDVYNKVQHGKGVWAPSIRYHNGEYYIYWGDPDFGVFMVHTTDPQGKWSEPVWVIKGKGIIDTTPLWDDDGRCYLVNGWAGSRCGFNSVITVRELSSDGTRAISQPRMVYDGLSEGNHTIEGPKLYKRDGYYYILAPAGGVETGWQLALRSRNIYGPYESKIVFNKDGIHQGGWVGDNFICFQDRGVYGRILHLLDVNMKDGWPMMRLSKHDLKTLPPFKGRAGEGLYTWHANYQEHFGFHANGFTRVYGEYTDMNSLNLWDISNLYLKKFEGETFRDTLHVTISAKGEGQQSGFIIMGRSYCRIAAEYHNGQFVVKQIINNNADGLSTEPNAVSTETASNTSTVGNIAARKVEAGANPIYQTNLTFAIECRKEGLCSISYSTDGKNFTQCPKPFKARQGKWIGAKYGIFSISRTGIERGWIDLLNS